jgi:CubicO group peptidase (beta-lactamase class C family)
MMSAGLSWDEWTHPYTDARNDAVQMIRDPDPVRFVLGRPAEAAPGTKFSYNTGISIVLGEIIRKASGLRVDRFAERFLCEPLGINDYYWRKLPDDIVETGGGLYLRPRDMAKLGRLCLNKGRWNNKQIVSEAWVVESTKNQLGSIQLPDRARADGYGYQWWRTSFDVGNHRVESYTARGRGGQFIFVFPDLQMVAVFTGWNDNLLLFQPMEMVQEYVVPAARRIAPNLPTEPKDVQARIRAILQQQQAANHIPGLAFVAVKYDKVMFYEAIGLRNMNAKLPVTPDTVFPVGSCTKSFTAIAAGISHDQGKISLDDSPHKYLPWFRMADHEANELVTLRDMLSHRTGLRAYADLAAEPAVLSREEYIKAATSAKPTAKFRSKFQYSNAMFSAAGEAIAKANQTTWEGLIESAIFKPLGMSSSRTSSDAGSAVPDHALGYVYSPASKHSRKVEPPRSLIALAPAGAVVSSARDLGQWLRFLTSGGTIDGKRILQQATLRDITGPHIPINENMSYGLGWVNYRWNGHVVIEHNGGSQGICALVSFIPDRRVGFAILGNTSPNQLTAIAKAGRLLWPLLLGETERPSKPAPANPAASKADSKPAPSPTAPALPSVDELLARIIAAHGGERNMRKHSRTEIHAHKVYENQGISADVVIRSSAPSSRSEEEKWSAAGKSIGQVRSFFDGTRGGQETTFGQDATFAGDELERMRQESTCHAILETRKLYSQVAVDRTETFAGEETFVLKLVSKSGPPILLFVSARTSLILKEQTDGESMVFSDHRNIDGEVMPFRTSIQDSLGESTVVVQDVKFNVEIPPETFWPKKP